MEKPVLVSLKSGVEPSHRFWLPLALFTVGQSQFGTLIRTLSLLQKGASNKLTVASVLATVCGKV